MHITFAPREILQIDDARIVFRNFEGRGDKFNREGDRNFALVIPDRPLTMEEADSFVRMYKGAEIVASEEETAIMFDGEKITNVAEALMALGWNVKIKPPRDEDDSPFMYLVIKVKFNDRGPTIYLKSGRAMNRLDERTVKCLDDIDIESVDMDIRPYDWEARGATGRTAYLESIHVHQRIDRFAARYADAGFENDYDENPFA